MFFNKPVLFSFYKKSQTFVVLTQLNTNEKKKQLRAKNMTNYYYY